MFSIKTIIELFDECQVKNVVAALRFMPKKVVFVGYREVMKKKKMNDLKKFFNLRGLKIELEFQFVDRYDYSDAFKTLNRILDENEECCFDLTGGKEIIIAAMGAISAERRVPMVQFNIKRGTMTYIKNYEALTNQQTAAMTVLESITLNGGAIANKNSDELEWDLSDDFRQDIEALWKINGRDSSAWNRFSKQIARFGKEIEASEDLSLKVNISNLDERQKEELLNNQILDEMKKERLFKNFSLKNNLLSIQIKNEQVLRCIIKAGNILELYAYMVATEMAEEKPGFYDDIKVGIKVDWDGIENGKFSKIKDTTNEIDLFMMRDLVPVFISCKNGDVDKEALYELNTVAEKFGGEYARKVLMATFISKDELKKRFLLQRAKDMRIEVIENIDKMTKQEFKEAMKRRVK